jgi:hypothetical protein
MAKGTAAARPRREVSAATRALLDEMSMDGRPASEEALSAVGAKLRELRDLDGHIADLEHALAEKKARHLLIRERELVDLLDAAGQNKAGLPPEGNQSGFDVEIANYYHANISSDWEPRRRDRAFSWIRRHHPGMLRSTLTVSLGKGSEKQLKKLESACRKLKIPFSVEFGVPWNTLTAFVREQIEEHRRRPPLELLGATAGRVAKIKKQKEK